MLRQSRKVPLSTRLLWRQQTRWSKRSPTHIHILKYEIVCFNCSSFLNSFIHFLFVSWESSITRKNVERRVAPTPAPHRGGLGQIPGPEPRSMKVPIVSDSEKIRAFRLYFVKLELKTSQRPVKIRKSIKRSNLKLKIEILVNSQAFSQPFIRMS